jgi:hypothetical protein
MSNKTNRLNSIYVERGGVQYFEPEKGINILTGYKIDDKYSTTAPPKPTGYFAKKKQQDSEAATVSGNLSEQELTELSA